MPCYNKEGLAKTGCQYYQSVFPELITDDLGISGLPVAGAPYRVGFCHYMLILCQAENSCQGQTLKRLD